MVKFIRTKLRIMYTLFISIVGIYVGQQVYMTIQGGKDFVKMSQKRSFHRYRTHPSLMKSLTRPSSTSLLDRSHKDVESVNSNQILPPLTTSLLDPDTVRSRQIVITSHQFPTHSVGSKQILTSLEISHKEMDGVRINQILKQSHKSKENSPAISNKNFDLKTLLRLNTDQHIRNIEKFPLKLGNDSVVLLVQVHNRLEDLKILIESLRRVRYINESLLVFSHDLYSKPLFEVIKSIDFCPVMQLFYPYSIQFYDKSFPGDSPADCPTNLTRTFVEEHGTTCYNADFYDSFGHYREGRVTQMKHHWLWKQHYVFDRLRVLRGYQGIVLRLDNDYYLAEDTIYLIRAINKVQPKSCPECLMYIMGDRENTDFKPDDFKDITGIVEVLKYASNVGRGMAYRAEFWRKFTACARTFCYFDDYNWDWSLQHTSVDCMNGFKVLKSSASRIFHVGACSGFHRHNETCNSKMILGKVVPLLDQVKQFLYPKALKVARSAFIFNRRKNGYGGWADPRDQLLCMKVIHNETNNDNLLSDIDNIISM